MAAFVLQGGTLTFTHASVNSGSAVDVSTLANGCTIGVATDEFDVSAWGDLAHTWVPGAGNSTFQTSIWLEADMAMMLLLLQFVEANKSSPGVAVVARLKSGAKAVGNPEFTFNVNFKDTGTLGGDWNSPHNAELSFNVTGQVTISDGTTTVTI